MNKSQFISTLKNPSIVSAGSVEGLSDLVNRYPYFQSAQLLLTKAYHSSENLNFETSLKRTAAYAANRTQLHALLFPIAEEPINKVIEKRVPVQEKNTKINALPTELNEEKSTDVEHPITKDTSISKELTHEIEKKSVVKQLVPEVKPETKIPTLEKEEIITHPTVVPKTPEEEVKAETTLVEKSSNITSAVNSETATEANKKSVLDQDKFSIDFSKVEDNTANENALQNQILSAAVSSSILLEVSDEIPDIDSFTPNYSTQEPDTPFEEKALLETESVSLPDGSHSFTDWLKQIDGSDKEEIFEEKNENTSLFFENKKEKVGFYSPVKMARLSVQENDDLVTETLANIYADQEHFEKAINAFEKLQLKYPEKRVYFASRIKEIQNHLNT